MNLDNVAIIIPFFLFVSVGFGLVYALLFCLLHKIKILKPTFLPMLIFSVIVYIGVTFAAGYLYKINSAPSNSQSIVVSQPQGR
jgi:hypothetical protein